MFYLNEDKKNQTTLFNQREGGKSFSLLMFFYVLVSFFVQTILLFFTEQNSFLYLAVCSLLSSVCIGFVVIYQTKIKKRTVKILALNKFKTHALLPTLLLSLGMFFGLGFVNLKFFEILSKIGVNVKTPTIIMDNFWQFTYFSLTLAILPAIFEELFFRGLVLSALEGHKTIVKAVSVGLLFALYHCSLAQFFYQFIYGFALSLIAIKFKSIIPCIIAHFLNNFAVIFLEYFKINIDLYNVLYILLGALALIVFAIYMGLLFKKDKTCKRSEEKIYSLYLYSIFGIFICLLMIVSALFV